jgi:glycosyltransferase involved in cell wall biosynthesis
MPHIILEAQVMGKPVVVTDVGNNREVIERTGGGIVIHHIGDISGLMHAVNEMLYTPPDPNLLRQSALMYFDLKKAAQKYYDVLLGNRLIDTANIS